MAATKKTQHQRQLLEDAANLEAEAAYNLVRPGLASEDHGDIGEPVPEDLGAQLARIAAGEDSSATSAETKRAKLQLPSWRRQEAVLRGYEALGNLTAACESAGVSRRTADHWRRVDALGFADRLANAQGGFGDRLEALAWDQVQRMKPGQNPTLLICLLNATLPNKYRPAVQVDPVTARDTLAELRRLASTGTAAGDPPDDRGAAAVAEAERLLSTRATPAPGNRAEGGDDGDDGGHQGHRDQGLGPDPEESGPGGAQ